jgi:hypothetical protein
MSKGVEMSTVFDEIEWAKRTLCGRGDIYGEEWKHSPMVAFTKQGFTFNRVFLETFGFQKDDRICFGLWKSRLPWKICFMEPKEDSPPSCVFHLKATNVKSKNIVHIQNQKAANELVEYRGKAYKARMNNSCGIIEVELGVVELEAKGVSNEQS